MKFTPEQKKAWKAKLGSRFIKVIPSYRYHPRQKAPSRRDRIRMHGRMMARHSIREAA